MMPEVARATRPEPSTSADQRERLIESVSQLLSSGRPLSEILAEVKGARIERYAGRSDTRDSFEAQTELHRKPEGGSIRSGRARERETLSISPTPPIQREFS